MATKDASSGSGGAYRADSVLLGPKKPYWRCKCGETDKRSSRLSCRSCNAPAPRDVQKRAAKITS
eukprot:12918077-Prorocentrum_lima.AAC.1